MKKAPLYSRSRSPLRAPEAPAPDAVPAVAPADPAAPPSRLASFALRHERRLWAGAVLVLLAAFGLWQGQLAKAPPALTLKQIDHAMRQSIAKEPLPSLATQAYDTVIPSVVRVVGLMTEGDEGDDAPRRAQPGPNAPADKAR